MTNEERHALIAALGQAISDEVTRAMAEYAAQLTRLESKLESAELTVRELRYAGTWSSQGKWKRGNFVSHQGSLWHCNLDGINTVPGHDHDGWQLAVKSMARA